MIWTSAAATASMPPEGGSFAGRGGILPCPFSSGTPHKSFRRAASMAVLGVVTMPLGRGRSSRWATVDQSPMRGLDTAGTLFVAACLALRTGVGLNRPIGFSRIA